MLESWNGEEDEQGIIGIAWLQRLYSFGPSQSLFIKNIYFHPTLNPKVWKSIPENGRDYVNMYNHYIHGNH